MGGKQVLGHGAMKERAARVVTVTECVFRDSVRRVARALDVRLQAGGHLCDVFSQALAMFGQLQAISPIDHPTSGANDSPALAAMISTLKPQISVRHAAVFCSDPVLLE